MAKEEAKEVIYPLGLSKPQVWIGIDQTPLPTGSYGRLIDHNSDSPTITLQDLAGARVQIPKKDLLFFIDHRLVKVNTQIDRNITYPSPKDPQTNEWQTYRASPHTTESPYIPFNKLRQSLSDNLPGESFEPGTILPEITVLTGQKLRRAGIQTMVITNGGIDNPYSTNDILSLVINHTRNRIVVVDTTPTVPSFHSRDTNKIELLSTVSRKVTKPTQQSN